MYVEEGNWLLCPVLPFPLSVAPRKVGAQKCCFALSWMQLFKRTLKQASGVQVSCSQLHTVEVWKEMKPVLCVSTDEMQEGKLESREF